MLTISQALFALGLFDWQEEGQTTRVAFVATIILVAGATYSLSWLWAVQDSANKSWPKLLPDSITRPFCAWLNSRTGFRREGWKGRRNRAAILPR